MHGQFPVSHLSLAAEASQADPAQRITEMVNIGLLAACGAAAETFVTADDLTAKQLALAAFAAALGGALINVLFALKAGSRPLDVLIAGTVSLFSGVVLAPALVRPLELYLPGLADAGQVPVAGCVALFGAPFIQRILEDLRRRK